MTKDVATLFHIVVEYRWHWKRWWHRGFWKGWAGPFKASSMSCTICLIKCKLKFSHRKGMPAHPFVLFQGCLTLNNLSIYIHYGICGFILVAHQLPLLQANQLNVSCPQWHDRAVFLDVSNNTALINRNMGLRNIMQSCLQSVYNKEEPSSPYDISTMRQALSCKHKLYPKMVMLLLPEQNTEQLKSEDSIWSLLRH